MKKSGILHPEVLTLTALMGHTDYIVIADRGFPVPPGPMRINLGLVDDKPTVMDVLDALLTEADLDRIIVTTEMQEISPQRLSAVRNCAEHRAVEVISHQAFKTLASNATGVIKTADTCPYSNVIIVSG